MSKRIEIIGSSLVVTDTDTETILYDVPKNLLYYEYTKLVEENLIWFYKMNGEANEAAIPAAMLVSDAVNKAGDVFTVDSFIEFANTQLGTVDVILQDSTTPLMIVDVTLLVTETTLSSLTAKDNYIINVTDATGFVVGQYLTIYNGDANRVFFCHIIAINTLAITIDSPLDFEFPAGSFVSVGSSDMAVDGSVTPQIFGVRNSTGVSIPLIFDISRIAIECTCTGTADLSKFGDIVGGVARGLVARRVDGTWRNIFNVKTNAELKMLMDIFEIQAAIGNQQNGFTGIWEFGGYSNLGSVARIGALEDVQFIVQDDLSALLTLGISVHGSEVTV